MTFRKITLLSLMAFSFTNTPVQASGHSEIRTQALATLGVILGLGGTYQLVKRSENNTLRLSDILSGLLLIAAGVGTIFISSQLIHEIDNSFK